MRRATRILLVTVGLAVAGSLFGALAGALSLAIIGVTVGLASKAGVAINADMLVVAAGDGAVFGLILGPLTAWLALRRVPFGLAMLTATAASTVGAILGASLPFGPVLGAVGGFLLTAVWLRRHASMRTSTTTSRVA